MRPARSQPALTSHTALQRSTRVPRAATARPSGVAGSSSYFFPEASIAFTGDALVTHDFVAGRVGPCVICRAFTQDSQAALASLEKIAEHELATMLPGHGEPWTDGLAWAARQAVANGIR
ncbi:hypothetical protein [Streptomyces sp. NPDC001153]